MGAMIQGGLSFNSVEVYVLRSKLVEEGERSFFMEIGTEKLNEK